MTRRCDDGPARAGSCDFCSEFGDAGDALFQRIYAGVLEHRLVDREGSFVALPTLGQLLPGSLLVMPLDHYETIADAQREPEAGSALHALMDRVVSRVESLGRPVLFEHGARAHTGGGCGIHHAHLHVVPVPGDLALQEIFPDGHATWDSLPQALDGNSDVDEYLLARDTTGRVGSVRPDPDKPRQYPSQYFRQLLASRFALPGSWDWRSYQSVEPAVVATVEAFARPA